MNYKLTPNILKIPCVSFVYDGFLEIRKVNPRNVLLEFFKDDSLMLDFLNNNQFFTVTF